MRKSKDPLLHRIVTIRGYHYDKRTPRKAKTHSYIVSSAVVSLESHSDYTRLVLRQRTPGKAESDSDSVSSAVVSLGPSNEHFHQHEQGRKYGTKQFREALLQCDEHGVGERLGRASRIVTIRG